MNRYSNYNGETNVGWGLLYATGSLVTAGSTLAIFSYMRNDKPRRIEELQQNLQTITNAADPQTHMVGVVETIRIDHDDVDIIVSKPLANVTQPIRTELQELKSPELSNSDTGIAIAVGLCLGVATNTILTGVQSALDFYSNVGDAVNAFFHPELNEHHNPNHFKDYSKTLPPKPKGGGITVTC